MLLAHPESLEIDVKGVRSGIANSAWTVQAVPVVQGVTVLGYWLEWLHAADAEYLSLLHLSHDAYALHVLTLQ